MENNENRNHLENDIFNKTNDKETVNKKEKSILIGCFILLIFSVVLLLYSVLNSLTITKQNNLILGDVNNSAGYTIGFVGDGATTYGTRSAVAQCGNLPKIEIPTKNGYEFLGYYINDEKFYNADGTGAKQYCMPEGGEIILWAKWKQLSIPSYKVTFNMDGATKSGYPGETTVLANGSMPNLISLPEKTGYIFKGYYYGNIQYYNSNGNSVKNFSENKGIELVAKWESNGSEIHTVTLVNNVNGNIVNMTVTVEYGKPMPKIFPPVNSNYDFYGYFTDNGVKYYNSDGTSARNYDLKFDEFLQAEWHKKTTDNNQSAAITQDSNSQSFKTLSSMGIDLSMTSGSYDEKMKFQASDVTNIDQTKNLISQLDNKNIKKYKSYKTSLSNYNGGYIFNIKIPLNGLNGSLTRAYIVSNSKLVRVNNSCDGNNFYFNVTNLSQIILVEYKDEQSIEKTPVVFTSNFSSGITSKIELPSSFSESNFDFRTIDITDTDEGKNTKKLFKDMNNVMIVNTSVVDENGKNVDFGTEMTKQFISLPEKWDSNITQVYEIRDGKRILLSSSTDDNFVNINTDHSGQFVIVENKNLKNAKNIKAVSKEEHIMYKEIIISVIGIIISSTIIFMQRKKLSFIIKLKQKK